MLKEFEHLCSPKIMFQDPCSANNMDEIEIWRRDFLNERFCCSPFKFIQEKDKEFLTTCFMSTPTKDFKNPWQTWNDCICVLIQNKS